MLKIPKFTFYKDKPQISLDIVLSGLSKCCQFPHDFSCGYSNKINITCESPTIRNKLYKEYRIYYLLFESTKLPSPWTHLLNKQADEIWTSQDWLKQTFINCGIEVPIQVIPLGLNPIENFTKTKKPYFQFTIIAAFLERKAVLETYQSFLKLFKNKDVKLRIHCPYGNPEYRSKIKPNKQVIITYNLLNQKEYKSLWEDTDCILSLSKGEGWGYPPREALFYNIPAIVSDIPAYEDLKDYRILKVKIKRKIKAYYDNPCINLKNIDCGEFWEFDADDLEQKMLEINNLKKTNTTYKPQTWEDLKPFINTKFSAILQKFNSGFFK